MTNLEQRIRDGLTATADRIPDSSTGWSGVGEERPRPVVGVRMVAVAAVAVLVVFAPLLFLGLNRGGSSGLGDQDANPDPPTGPTREGAEFVEPQHISLRFEQDVTLICDGLKTVDNGGFDSFAVDLWIDNEARLTRFDFTYPDGSTYALIFEGTPQSWERAWGQGTDRGRNAGCLETLDGGGTAQSVAGWGYQDLSDLWFTTYLTPVTTDTDGATITVEGQPTLVVPSGTGTYLDARQFAEGSRYRREFTLDETGARVMAELRDVHLPGQFDASASIEVDTSIPVDTPAGIFDTSTFTPLWGSGNDVVTTTQQAAGTTTVPAPRAAEDEE